MEVELKDIQYPRTNEDVERMKHAIIDYENARSPGEKERTKAVLKMFHKHFPKTPEAFQNRIHGYLYLKYMYLYIYKMASALGRFGFGPNTAVRPTEPIDEEIEDLINMCVQRANMGSMEIETNAYHGKVLILDDAKKFFKITEDINLTDLPKTVIPYTEARSAVMKNYQALGVIECSCRHIRGDAGCWPRDVCITIGEPWVSFQEEYLVGGMKPRRITQEEALKILDEQHELGHVHNVFFKDACNDQMYGICNCCSCCCVAMQAQNYAKCPMFAPSGYLSKVDNEKCVGSGTCVSKCSFGVLEIVDGKRSIVEGKSCMGCGVCVDNCPHGALELVRDDPNINEPFDLDVLIPKYSAKQ